MAANSQDSSNLEDGIDWNRLEELLSGGQASGNSVHRLLHAAVRRNDAQALQLLLNHGADANAQADSDGQTPLHLCVEYSCSDCLKLLLTAGRADPNAVNQADETPLHSAAAATGSSSSTISTVRELLAGGADCNRVDCFGDNPLHRACQAENTPAVALLLKARPQLVNLPTGGDQKLTCLHIAASAENSELFTLLLCHGADFLAEDARGRSAIDLLLDKQDTTRIDCLGRHLFEEVRRFRHGESIYDLLDSPEGGRYLEQLLRIDGVCSPKQASTKSAEELAQAQSFSLAELRRLVAYRKLDAERLVSALEAAFEAGLADVLDLTPAHGELTQRLVEKTVQLVLLPQETELLGRLLSCRRLWRCLAWRMQAGVRQLYDTALRGSKAGIRQILRTECSRDDVATVGGKSAIDLNKLNAFLASTTTYWQFRRRELRLVEDSRAAMRDPLQSLALWATLTGRMRLVPSLLSQEEFDLVPLSLLIATLLRSLATRRDVEDVFADRADKVADQCEGMAIQVIKEVKEVDNSYGNNLTIAYVSLPLFNFANYTVLDLAARGGASSFIKLDIVELATDKSWYGDFYDFRQSFSREALILSGFLPPFMLLLPSLVQRMRNPESRRFLETITEASVTACEGEEEDKLEMDNDEAEKATRLALLEDSEKDGRGAEQHGSQDASGGGRMTCREFVTELLEFYGTPCVKFRISVLFYFAFVGLLSVMILSDFQGPSSPIELICYFTILGIFIEEVREMISSLRQETLSVYLSDGWNVIDLIATLCGFLAFISRQISSKKFDFLALISDGTHERRSRDLSYVFIVITTLIVWIRILFISIVLESVGVKLKMLSLMIKKDFIPFLYILIVIMLGFGIAFHALLWPNGQYYAKGKAIDIDPPDILIQMFKRTFYTIVGEYGLDELETECQMHDPSASKASVAAATAASINATAGSLLSAAATEEKEIADEVVDDVDKCVSFPGSVLVPYVLMVVYIVVVQVLLLNVIVAMFSKTIDMVDSESKAMWLFERYDLNKEFIKRSALPPPFNIVLEARNLICWCLSKIMRLSRRRCSQAPEADQRQQQPLDIIKQHLNINDSEVKRQNFHNFVYLFYLFYQAVMLRRLRRKLDGFQADESELSSEGVLLLHRVGELRQVQSDLRDYLESQHSELSSVSQKLDRLLAMGGGDAGSG